MTVETNHETMMTNIKATLNIPEDSEHVRYVFELPQDFALLDKLCDCVVNSNETKNETVAKQVLSPEEKKLRAVASRKKCVAKRLLTHRASINAYMNRYMKEKYKNNEEYRNSEKERGRLRHLRNMELRNLSEQPERTTNP